MKIGSFFVIKVSNADNYTLRITNYALTKVHLML